MARSIKFRNDTYLSSDSVVYGRNTLSWILARRFALKLDFTIAEGATKSIKLPVNWGCYIFVNAHVYSNGMALITALTNPNVFRVTPIAKSQDSALPVFTYDFDTRILTVDCSKTSQMRGNLYQVNASV